MPNSLKYKNLAATQLNGSIDGSTTSIVVDSGSALPAVEFYAIIDNEIVLVTVVSGNTLTVTRAQEGTTGVTHNDNAAIAAIISKGTIERVMSDNIQKDVFANRYAQEKNGRMFLQSDATGLWRDDGNRWQKWDNLTKVLAPPLVSTWTWRNQGSATGTDLNGGIVLTAPTSGTHSLRILERTIPSHPYTVSTAMITEIWPANDGLAGIALVQSSDGKLITFVCGYNGNVFQNCSVHKWNSVTSYNSTYVGSHYSMGNGHAMFFRVSDDSTDRKFECSHNGRHWIEMAKHSRTDFLTADKIGIMVDGGNSQPDTAIFFHWNEAG